MAVGVVNVQADATLQVGDGTETQRRRSAPATTLHRHPTRKDEDGSEAMGRTEAAALRVHGGNVRAKGIVVYGKLNPHVVLRGATFGHIEWQGLNPVLVETA